MPFETRRAFLNSCGAGGSRTLVQTWDLNRFLHAYFRFNCRKLAAPKLATNFLVSWFWRSIETLLFLSRLFQCLEIRRGRSALLGDISLHNLIMKEVTITSVIITQQERSYFRQLKCEQFLLRAITQKPCMLTTKSSTLSIPSSPRNVNIYKDTQFIKRAYAINLFCLDILLRLGQYMLKPQPNLFYLIHKPNALRFFLLLP